jgi:hypothetical protein
MDTPNSRELGGHPAIVARRVIAAQGYDNLRAEPAKGQGRQ